MKKRLTTTEYSYTVTYEPIRGGGYQVTVPVLPGLITYGRNIEEAKKMARDAISCHLEGLQIDHEFLPNENSLMQEKLTVSLVA